MRRDRGGPTAGILTAAILGAGTILMIVVMGIAVCEMWQQDEPAAQQQEGQASGQQEPKRLKIEIPDPCNEGTVTVYANGGVYCFYGTFDIENDGRNGEQIQMTVEGYMEAEYPHGEPAAPEIKGP